MAGALLFIIAFSGSEGDDSVCFAVYSDYGGESAATICK
jgi:hypothetical protein